MGDVIHFNSRTDRLNFIRGKHTEIKPIEVKEPVKAEKPKGKKTTNKKTKKKEKE